MEEWVAVKKLSAPMRTLTYFLTQASSSRSFDPGDSDSFPNLTHMEQLVGTLLKYNSVDRFEPYLAEQWEASADQLVWTFHFRKGLRCEDGTKINAPNYIQGLHLAFRNHAPDADTPVFSHLKGWKKFHLNTKSSIDGIRAINEEQLSFEFEKIPDGLKFYLSMPYFGFFCESNFSKDGKWKDRNKITSSGAYKLNYFDQTENIIQLQLREDWILASKNQSPEVVNIPVVDGSSIYNKAHRYAMVQAGLDESTMYHNSWSLLEGAQTISSNVVLNPYRPYFSKKSSRQWFAGVLRKKIEESKKRFNKINISSLFYPSSSFEKPFLLIQSANSKLNPPVKINGEALTVEVFSLTNERLKFIKEIINAASIEADLRLSQKEIQDKHLTDAQYMKKRNSDLDIFFIHVDKGATAEPSVIKMMFCSKLGVQFPDTANRICKLTNEFEGEVLSPQAASSYNQKFHEILIDESAVIPIIHRGQYWLYSSDVDVTSLSPTMGVPRFDLIKLK